MARAKAEIQPVAENRKARHDYFVEETYEAGIVLVGSEVKSCRAGRVNLRDAYAQIKDGEIFLLNCHISPFEQANRFNHEPSNTSTLTITYCSAPSSWSSASG